MVSWFLNAVSWGDTMLAWISRHDEMPSDDERVLVYSPDYEEIRSGHEMTYRVIQGQFMRICVEATHWCRLVPPEIF